MLEKGNGKALLLSKYILAEYHYYNDEKVDITWENCTLRKWLNSEYINTIFSKKEQGAILTTNVINNDNEKYGTKGGNNTKDKLFLLSIDEAYKYFSNSSQRSSTYNWLLRSPGKSQNVAAYVYEDGDITEDIDNAYYSTDVQGVRPALWVKY